MHINIAPVILGALLATTAQGHPLKKCKATTTITVPVETLLPSATTSAAAEPPAYPTVSTDAETVTPLLPTAVEPEDPTTASAQPTAAAAPPPAEEEAPEEEDATAAPAPPPVEEEAAVEDVTTTATAAPAQPTTEIHVASFAGNAEVKISPPTKKAADDAKAKAAAAAAAKAKAAAAAKAKAAADAKAKAAAAAKAKAAADAKGKAAAAAEKAKKSIGAFKGTQSGIGSWFRSNHGQDSTSGRSWCNYPYKDYTNGFAPDISQMTGGTNAVYPHPRWEPSAKKFCGLEAEVYNPHTGVRMNMYIVDAFDHAWVRSPGSIDVMVKSWEKLTGKPARSKDTVIQGLQWKLTGRRSKKYSFGGPGDP
ncbi:hypothetical protein HDU86_000595 [Geranomyces michiganensis]|nr:hypothetical protein HDU86_000595 [Geranomyces michiganensis]